VDRSCQPGPQVEGAVVVGEVVGVVMVVDGVVIIVVGVVFVVRVVPVVGVVGVVNVVGVDVVGLVIDVVVVGLHPCMHVSTFSLSSRPGPLIQHLQFSVNSQLLSKKHCLSNQVK